MIRLLTSAATIFKPQLCAEQSVVEQPPLPKLKTGPLEERSWRGQGTGREIRCHPEAKIGRAQQYPGAEALPAGRGFAKVRKQPNGAGTQSGGHAGNEI